MLKRTGSKTHILWAGSASIDKGTSVPSPSVALLGRQSGGAILDPLEKSLHVHHVGPGLDYLGELRLAVLDRLLNPAAILLLSTSFLGREPFQAFDFRLAGGLVQLLGQIDRGLPERLYDRTQGTRPGRAG